MNENRNNIWSDPDHLGNVTTVSNINSSFQYTYDGLNRATQAVCLLTNIPGFATVRYKIDYRFDPVGNVTNRLISGLIGFTDTIETRYAYDVMNRLTNVVQLTNAAPTANAWYDYDSAGRLWHKGYGNGDVVTHAYDTESRLLSMGITNASSGVLWYSYGWDAGGNILAITNNGTNITLYGYDAVGQLTNEICFTNGLPARTTNTWVYDEAGNWLNATPTTRWAYNPDNELVGRVNPDDTNFSVTVTGTVEPGAASNKWYNTWADCRGALCRVSPTDGSFTLPNVPLYAGTNELTVTVRDVTGNTSQQTRTVSKGAIESFFYDGNGNLTNWLCGTTNWVYEWDWENRLTKVTSNAVVVLENWCDASGRRVAKKDLIEGQRLYLWDGWGSAALLSGNGQPVEFLTRGLGLAGDIGSLVAVTRMSGGLFHYYTHHSHRGDVVTTRNGTSTTGTYEYTAFGSLKAQTGTDVCRFKFSTKEREECCGWSYFGYRFYAPYSQSWVSRDPLGNRGLEILTPKRLSKHPGQAVTLELEDRFNLYRFAANAPVSHLDPFGFSVVSYCKCLFNCAHDCIFENINPRNLPTEACMVLGYLCMTGNSVACYGFAVCAGAGSGVILGCYAFCAGGCAGDPNYQYPPGGIWNWEKRK